jgi:hypothetical protein
VAVPSRLKTALARDAASRSACSYKDYKWRLSSLLLRVPDILDYKEYALVKILDSAEARATLSIISALNL